MKFRLALCLLVCGGFAWGEEEEPPASKVFEVSLPNTNRPVNIVDFYAESIGRRTKYMVLLPEGYAESEARYPVLYLLHGISQNYTVWPMMGITNYVEDLDLIVVLPDGGNSWYINWAQSDGDQVNRWDDFIAVELINHVDSLYRTIPLREGRAINGLSMGGYGAITLGLRHSDRFVSIGSHSGALAYAQNARVRIERGGSLKQLIPDASLDSPLDADVPEIIRIPGFMTQSERYPKGIPFLTAEDCNLYDPFHLVTVLPGTSLPHIYLDCGTEDSLMVEARSFVGVLLERNIPFTFSQSPGGHRPAYWSREVARSIAVQYSIMQQSLAAVAARAEMAPEPRGDELDRPDE